MAPWSGSTDVDEATLCLGGQLGSGGQGIVRSVLGQPEPLVFKKYKDPRKALPAALQVLVDLPGQLQPSERDRLRELTAWPLARVYDGGQLSGFLMREIPGQFMAMNSAGNSMKREVQYLVYQRKPMWGEIVPDGGVTIQTRVEVALEFARLMDLLHSKKLVVGDVSMMNVLWTGTNGRPSTIFLIDCDGIRMLGQSPVMPQVDTPDWQDRHQPATGPDLDTDRYKLALLVGRVLCCEPYIHPQDGPLPLPSLPSPSGRMTARIESLWQRAADPYGNRPDAAQWMFALSNRDEVTVSAPSSVRELHPSDIDKAALHLPATTPRPSIPVTPPTARTSAVQSARPSAPVRPSILLPPPTTPTP